MTALSDAKATAAKTPTLGPTRPVIRAWLHRVCQPQAWVNESRVPPSRISTCKNTLSPNPTEPSQANKPRLRLRWIWLPRRPSRPHHQPRAKSAGTCVTPSRLSPSKIKPNATPANAPEIGPSVSAQGNNQSNTQAGPTPSMLSQGRGSQHQQGHEQGRGHTNRLSMQSGHVQRVRT